MGKSGNHFDEGNPILVAKSVVTVFWHGPSYSITHPKTTSSPRLKGPENATKFGEGIKSLS